MDGNIRVGAQLETGGWRQGSVVKNEHVGHIFAQKNDAVLVLIVASQSCDIANDNLASDPFIEFSVGRMIDRQNGNLTFNKNPRVLHTELLIRTENIKIYDRVFVELKAYEKIQVNKKKLMEFSPDNNTVLVNQQLIGYVAWLAARYSRPALPSAFNTRIQRVDPKDQRKKKAKSVNSILSGIYVEIIPDKELPADQNYRVNMLGLVAADFTGDLTTAETTINDYAKIMKQAGMDVSITIQRENQVSVAVIKRFKRFYYDDLSLKSDAALPAETQTNL